MLVILLSGVFPACQQAVKQESGAPAAKTAIQVVGPKGEVVWPFAFEWKAAAAPDAIYRVTVYDVAERQLFEQDTRGTRLEGPRDLEVLLPSTRRFLWRVAVVDGDGKPIAESVLVEFTVK